MKEFVMKKLKCFSLLMVLFLLSTLFTGCDLEKAVDAAFFYIIIFAIVVGLCFVIPVVVVIRIKKKEQKIKAIAEAETAKLKQMPMNEFLKQNGFEQYCDIFKQNKIEKIFDALELSDADLVNIGISVLQDRKKLLSLLAVKLSASKGLQKRCPHCGSTNYQTNAATGTNNICNDCKSTFVFPKYS
jgi:NADH pyrophosphatase NudC (nudix superfamily)